MAGARNLAMRLRARTLRARVRSGLLQGFDLLRPRLEPGEIVAICHCHHPELVPELAHTLRKLPGTATLHLSSSRRAVLDRWTQLRSPPKLETVLHEVENRGRDVRPFVEIARALPLRPETLVLKIHGKQSSYSAQGESWRRDLLSGLLPFRSTPGRVASRFRENPRLGLLGAPRSFLSHPVYWGRNRDTINSIMAEICGAVPEEGDLGFFAGSMFWIRGALLLELLPHIDLDRFEPEPLPQDGSYAHALERVIPMAARRMGWQMGEIDSEASLECEAVRERKIAYL